MKFKQLPPIIPAIGLLPALIFLGSGALVGDVVDISSALSVFESGDSGAPGGFEGLEGLEGLEGMNSGESSSSPGTNEIHGTVYYDWFGDGDYAGDYGITGVIVELYADLDGNGLADDGLQPFRRTATDWWGKYSFTAVPDGDVVVVELDPPGSFSTNDVHGDHNDSMVGLTLVGYQSWTGVLFLDTDVEESKVQGTVWIDTDGSGTVSEEDTGHEGVSIDLYVDLDANGVLDPEDVLVDNVTTGSEGDYKFWWIVNGHYIIVKQTPANTTSLWDADGTANGAEAIAVHVESSNLDGNDFLHATISLTGKVRHDLNGDGDLSDGDDPGLLGVEMRLYEDTNDDGIFDPADDVWLGSTTTGRNGKFSFLELVDGPYLVVEVDPAGAVSTNDTGGNPLQPIGTDNWVAVEMVDGMSTSDPTFLDTNVTEATIKGKILDDTDGDGDRNDADGPLSGVMVRLFTDPNGDGDPEDGIGLHADPSNLRGIYKFRHVVPGNYVVVEEDPDPASSTNDFDDDPLGDRGTDNTIAVTLGAATIGGLDFLDTGAFTACIHGQVLNDDSATDDNRIGPEDAPIGGVEIEVFHDLNGNRMKEVGDRALGIVHSATDGKFLVPGLVQGSYLLVEADPAGAVSDDDTDGDPQDNTIGLQLQDADSTGHVFLDDNVSTHAISGTISNGTAPISGVSVTLQNADGNTIDTAQSAVDGAFRFPHLPDGTYTLIESNPGGSDRDGGDPDVTSVSLNGLDSTGNDFVDPGTVLATISGKVLDDSASNNNLIDESDAPVAGSYIYLVRDDNGDGAEDGAEPILAETLTAWDGTYSFHGLQDNNYVVVSVNSGGFSETDADGLANGPDAIAVTIVGGADSAGNDFLDEGLTLRSISGSVTDGTNPILGVVIHLFSDFGELIESTGTDINGGYTFPNLPNGSYLVEEVDPDGTSGGSDSDGPLNGDNTIAVDIFFENQPGMDFIDTLDASNLHDIIGHVYDDADGDGDVSDPSERPVDGVEITLYCDADTNGVPDGNEGVSQTRTDGNGKFEFIAVPNGSYLVAQSAPAGSHSTQTGSAGEDNGDPTLIPVSVAGEDATGNDFSVAIDPAGYFYDALTGEIIPGGFIDVLPSGFGVPSIVQSGITGQYSFVVDSADTYTMVITPPSGYFVDPGRAVAGASYDPTGRPDPDVIGSVEDPTTPGFLVDASAGANPYHLVFDLEPGDPLVLSNNIPLRTASIRSWGQFVSDHGLPTGSDSQPVPDQSGEGGNPDRDFQSNLLEYALTEDPSTGASPAGGGFSIDLVDHTVGRIDVSFTRQLGSLDLIYTIQTKAELTAPWMDLISIPAGQDASSPFLATPIGDGTEHIVYRDIANDSQSGLSTDLGFVRLKIALDSDQDGTPDTLPADGSPVLDHTKTFGWQSNDFNAAQTASFSHPFSNPPVFSGTVDFVVGAIVNVAGSSNNASLWELIGSGGSHYLQITSGPLEGQRFDIAAAAVISLTLVDDPDIFSESDGVTSLNTSHGLPSEADLAGQSFMVVPHLTIDQFADKNGSFAGLASGNPSQAAKLFFYNNRSVTPALETLLLVDLGFEQRWIRPNDFATLTDRGSTPVDRCGGFYIHPTLGPLVNQFAIGMVADHDLACAFGTGYNFVGGPYPLDQTPTGPNGRAMTVANGFAGGTNPTQATQILFWMGDFAIDQGASYVQGYDSYMQLDGGGMQRWIDATDPSVSDLGSSLIFESHRVAFIKMRPGFTIAPHIYPAPTLP